MMASLAAETVVLVEVDTLEVVDCTAAVTDRSADMVAVVVAHNW